MSSEEERFRWLFLCIKTAWRNAGSADDGITRKNQTAHQFLSVLLHLLSISRRDKEATLVRTQWMKIINSTNVVYA